MKKLRIKIKEEMQTMPPQARASLD